MTRRHAFLLAGLVVALAGGRTALAERLGSSYRGPEDVAGTKDTGASGSDSGSSEGGPEGSTRDSGGGSGDGGVGEGGGGGGGGEGGGGGGGGEGEGGGGGSPEGGGGGGDDSVGGGSSGGNDDAMGGGGGETSGSGGTGGGGAAPRGKQSGDSAQEQFQVVSRYFEHNRERLLGGVVEARNRRIEANTGSAWARISPVPRATRKRSSVGTDDRSRIFDIVKNNRLAAEDVVRDAAVIALGKIGTPDAVQLLRTRLEEETKWDIKEDILLALGIARTPEAIDTLIATLQSPKSARLHAYALLGLGLVGQGQSANVEKAGPAVLASFVEGIRKPKGREATVSAAALALGALRYAKAEDALVAAAKSKSTPEIVKVYVAQALGRLGTENCRKAVESLLGEKDMEVARAAVLALGEFPETGVLKSLLGKEALGRSDPLAAGFAAISIGKVLDRIPDSEWKKAPAELREIALKPAKGTIKSQYANLALSLFDGGIDGDVRSFAAEELKAMNRLNPDVLSSIAMACGISSQTSLQSALSDIAESTAADPKLRSYAALGVGMTGEAEKAAKTLRSVYESTDNPDVQRGAVLGLGLVGDRRDVAFLVNVIEKTDKSKPFAHYTRGAAVISLGLIRDGESVGAIQGLLRNPDAHVRAYAIAALGYLADKDTVPVLPSLFEHANFRQEFHALQVAMRTL